jgi:hypothetical protein
VLQNQGQLQQKQQTDLQTISGMQFYIANTRLVSMNQNSSWCSAYLVSKGTTLPSWFYTLTSATLNNHRELQFLTESDFN